MGRRKVRLELKDLKLEFFNSNGNKKSGGGFLGVSLLLIVKAIWDYVSDNMLI